MATGEYVGAARQRFVAPVDRVHAAGPYNEKTAGASEGTGRSTTPDLTSYQLIRDTIWITRLVFVPVRPVTR